MNQFLQGDCLDLMSDIPDATVDMVCSDLPYGVTARNEWDKVIDLEKMWEQYNRITKPTAAIVLFASQPFTTQLINSNLKNFRYDLVWEKNKSTGFLNAKVMPLRMHEQVLVFYRKKPIYNPQKTTGHKPVNRYTKNTSDGTNYGETKIGRKGGGSTERYPTSILKFPVINNDDPEKFHPTQKPVELLEFLIKSYTNEGDTVLDNAAGSGSTCIAAINTKRRYIGIEGDPEFYKKALQRISRHEKG
jgi:DNA modification methylase